MQKQQLLHYPRLDTILMVEDAIRSAEEFESKRQLWLSLKKKVMYQTFNLIISYLEDSGKIVMKNGRIIWIWNPEGIKKWRKKSVAYQ